MNQARRGTRMHASLPGAVALALTLSACGGGGGGSPATGAVASTTTTATAMATSSGTITAFGSVFVNGHEFATTNASVVDDDAGTTTPSLTALEVGRTVDVMSVAAASSAAAEIHLHPLARGPVDASDMSASTLLVLGQTVDVTGSTLYSDHRACASAATSPCARITGQSGLVATSGTGAGATAGTYVTVDGYLLQTSGGASIVATLIAVADAPTAAAPFAFKAEGPVVAAGSSSIAIGGLTIDLSTAMCVVNGKAAACAAAFSVGQIVSVVGSASPVLPATRLVATGARLVASLPVETVGASVEFEGKVSASTASPASIVVRGVAVDLSALPAGATLPAVGDDVRVTGTIATGGTRVTASALAILQVARNALFGFEGDGGTAAAGTAAGSYVLSVLGQPVTVTAQTRLADFSVARGTATSSFNSTNFLAYYAASASHHVIVRAAADATGKLTALSLTLEPASTVAAVAGNVDASPVPVNGSVAGTTTSFAVHGVVVHADPTAVIKRKGVSATVASGDAVIVRGTFSSVLTVAAPASAASLQPDASNVVVDLGARVGDQNCF